jgi:hypothetical protein
MYGAEVRLLEEAIESFLRQDFMGQKEMIVYGTMPGQELMGNFPNVKLVTCKQRPSSLGAARNAAIEMSRGTHIVLLDSDDIALPGFLSFYANNFDGNDWLMPSLQAYAEGEQIKKLVPATLNQFAFTRQAWDSVGRYDKALSVGEDRNLIGRITEKFTGKKVEIEPQQVAHIYRWGTGGFHMSGARDNSQWHKAEVWLTERMRLGKLPCGMIQLQPNWKRDYRKQIAEFVGGVEADLVIKKNETCIVQMGRLGDVINMLPIAQHLAMKGKAPHLLVSREFAPVLDGCSYVKALPTDITVHEIAKGVAYAKKTFADVIVTQIYGHNHKQETLTPSWPQESWRQGGQLDHFHDREWPLVFDRRDKQREALLIAKLMRTSKPKIITNLTSAVSVPFPNGKEVLGAVQKRFGATHEIVDIGNVKAHRFYDLIGLYEKAQVIVSIDTATMHLAAATPQVPLVALVNDKFWLGPNLRFGCSARLPYREATPERVCQAISDAPGWMYREKNKVDVMKVLATPIKSGPRLNLKRVTLWASCWSEDRENLIKTMRALRYCLGVADFGEVILFSYLPIPKHALPIREVQIPKLDPSQFNIFANFTAPAYFKTDFSLSVHSDSLILKPELWTPEFFNYDYIGACWPDGVVGNAGFCLTSRKFYEAQMRLPFFVPLPQPVQSTFGPINFTPSDDFVCRLHRKTLEGQGLKFAPRKIASQFSTESVDKHLPSFGYHGRIADPIKHAQGWGLIEQSERIA